MIRKKRFDIEPWIEALVQNYGLQGKAKILKGYILEVIQVPSSHPLKENAVALLLISDGMVSIPAVLTNQAWEAIQEMEERDIVFGLKNCTTFLRVYSLEFHCEPEMYKSSFFISIDKLATVAFGAMIDKVPCCTSLPTVQQKICETWQSLQGENLSNTMNTQSGVYLSDFLTAWFEDKMSSLLADLRARLAPPSAPHPSSSSPPLPGPSTARADPPPAERSARLLTGWHVDRVQYKGQEAFTVPVSHLYIPANQMELMQRQLDGNEEHEPQDGDTSANPAVPEERALPDSGQDGNCPSGSAEQEKGPANPWDIFAPAVGNLSTSSLEVSSSGSTMPDLAPDGQSPSLLLSLDRDHAAGPMVSSTRASPFERSNSHELFTSSDQSTVDELAAAEGCPLDTKRPQGHAPEPRPLELCLPKGDMQTSAGSSTPSLIRAVSSGSGIQSLPPYQKPRPLSALNCSPVQGDSSHSNSEPFTSMTDNPEPRLLLLSSSPDHAWHNRTTPPLCLPTEEEEEEGFFARQEQSSAFREAGVGSHEGAEKERGELKDSCAGRAPKRKLFETSSPPSWLYHTQAAGRDAVRRQCEGPAAGAGAGPASATDIHSPTKTHPDGTPFFYRYEPAPQVAQALSLFKVPDDLVRWSVRYLLGPDGWSETS